MPSGGRSRRCSAARTPPPAGRVGAALTGLPVSGYAVPVVITVTDAAIRQIQDMLAETPDSQGCGLRISVEKGGCAGMQYEMRFDRPNEADLRYSRNSVDVIVDPESAAYLDGVSVDYVDGLTGAGFRIVNPNAVRSCGCGSSFEALRNA